MSPRIGLTADMIVQVAIDIANKEGTHAVTIASVAKQLNVRPPSLYNHISGLTELHRSMTLKGLIQLHDTLVNATKDHQREAAITALTKGYMSFARKHKGLYEATLDAPKEKDLEITQASEKIVALVLQTLAYLELNEENALHAVRGLRSILHGFASLEQHGGFGIPLDIDESINYTIQTLLRGLKINNCEEDE
ncbi:TetR/AcrR family transcriptional regulator [Radiobacillus sp. PE A8.2]|uniref:TetR/AcrR family transcriptional regulator n=1 Tax=Radiobacillus sp. PE A8.2 TaxID=3380349 RepID=UPI00388EC13A